MITSIGMCFRYPFDVFKCGKCPECLEDKRREWSIRLQVHTYYSGETPYWCHLTYDNEHVKRSSSGLLTLCKSDVQKFLKRLRYNVNKYEKDKNLSKSSIKYFIAGEYGPNGTHRPHYHCVIFGLPKVLEEEEARKIIQASWQNGDVRHTSCWLKDYCQLHYSTKYAINNYEDMFKGKVKPFKVSSTGFGIPYIEFALKNDLFDKQLQSRFRCDYYPRLFDNKKCPIRWHDLSPLVFDVDLNKFVPNPLLLNFRDFIEWYEVRHGVPHLRRYPLPRYFQEKLFTDDFRTALGIVKKWQLQNRSYDYAISNSDGDLAIPEWKQTKLTKLAQKRQRKKDIDLNNKYLQVLND